MSNRTKAIFTGSFVVILIFVFLITSTVLYWQHTHNNNEVSGSIDSSIIIDYENRIAELEDELASLEGSSGGSDEDTYTAYSDILTQQLFSQRFSKFELFASDVFSSENLSDYNSSSPSFPVYFYMNASYHGGAYSLSIDVLNGGFIESDSISEPAFGRGEGFIHYDGFWTLDRDFLTLEELFSYEITEPMFFLCGSYEDVEVSVFSMSFEDLMNLGREPELSDLVYYSVLPKYSTIIESFDFPESTSELVGWYVFSLYSGELGSTNSVNGIYSWAVLDDTMIFPVFE